MLKLAITKYGIQNFRKDILFQFDSEADMNAKEKELVTEEFLKRPDVYNICPGGKGGWGYVNDSSEKHLDRCKKARVKTNEILKQKYGENWKSYVGKLAGAKIKELKVGIFDPNFKPIYDGFKGKHHSEEFKQRLREINSIHQTGSKNSQYGTCWITNGLESRKIKKEDIDTWIDLGYSKGRKI